MAATSIFTAEELQGATHPVEKHQNAGTSPAPLAISSGRVSLKMSAKVSSGNTRGLDKFRYLSRFKGCPSWADSRCIFWRQFFFCVCVLRWSEQPTYILLFIVCLILRGRRHRRGERVSTAHLPQASSRKSKTRDERGSVNLLLILY